MNSHLQICLHTHDEHIALKKAKQLYHEAQKQWSELRLKTIGSGFDKFLIQYQKPPALSDALELYLTIKGNHRDERFFVTTKRNISYLISAVGDRDLTGYSTADAARFRTWLIEHQGLSTSSTRRVMSSVKSVFNLAIGELGLAVSNPFSFVYIPPKEASLRGAIPEHLIFELQEKCLTVCDEKRLIIALLIDSGVRLNEALGLHKNDISFESEAPSLMIREHPWRRLKTHFSTRTIPLIGSSLIAAKKILNQSEGSFLFPSYCNEHKTKANSASAALNLWLKKEVGQHYVIHSLRHSFRDRLRAIECPSEIINELGGWSKSSVGENYGNGYPLNIKTEWMAKLKTFTYPTSRD